MERRLGTKGLTSSPSYRVNPRSSVAFPACPLAARCRCKSSTLATGNKRAAKEQAAQVPFEGQPGVKRAKGIETGLQRLTRKAGEVFHTTTMGGTMGCWL
jgi:hypothetical protein